MLPIMKGWKPYTIDLRYVVCSLYSIKHFTIKDLYRASIFFVNVVEK